MACSSARGPPHVTDPRVASVPGMPSAPTQVLLVTCAGLPYGEPGAPLLDAALAERGIRSRWAAWDDPGVDWSAADLVLVRSAWDYEHRREEFLAWAGSVERSGARLVNSAAVLAWNTDKGYLVELADGAVGGTRDLPVVPTVAVGSEEGLGPAVDAMRPAVVKPRVGAGGRGVVVFGGGPAPGRGPSPLGDPRLGTGPWIVQPLVPSVRSEGEASVFVLGGHAVSQVQKLPGGTGNGGAEIRVQPEYGGSTAAVDLDGAAAALAEHVVARVGERLGAALAYARVDLMRLPDGRLALSELEATEPGLYLDRLPGNAAAFADVVRALLG